MESLNKFHLCISELRTLINEVDHLESIVVDAMIREQHPDQHVVLNKFYTALEKKRGGLDVLHNEIRSFEQNFDADSANDLKRLRDHEREVDQLMDRLHLLKAEVCSFINNEIDQQSMAS